LLKISDTELFRDAPLDAHLLAGPADISPELVPGCQVFAFNLSTAADEIEQLHLRP
jgi:hypothetical protein